MSAVSREMAEEWAAYVRALDGVLALDLSPETRAAVELDRAQAEVRRRLNETWAEEDEERGAA